MHEFVVALNKLKDQIKDLASKVDFLLMSPAQQLTRKYLDTQAACAILHVSDRTLYKMRSHGELPFIKIHHKIIYQASDVYQYMEKQLKKTFR
jgi:excisionase family DNA binding protein